jgi:hypothetical protein
MSKAVRFYEAGGPEVLKLVDVEVPRPNQGEVRIRVKAIGLNRAEAMYRSGSYIQQPVFPAQLSRNYLRETPSSSRQHPAASDWPRFKLRSVLELCPSLLPEQEKRWLS